MTKKLTKDAFDTIERDLPSADIATMEGVVNQSRNSLLSSLNMTNNFFVDQSNKNKIDNNILQGMYDKERELNIKITGLRRDRDNYTTEDTRAWGLRDRETALAAIWAPTPAQAQELVDVRRRRAEIDVQLIKLNADIASISHMIAQINPHRKAEYQELSNLTNRFDYTRSIPDIKQDIYNLGLDIMVPWAPAPTGYNLYDEHGNVLVQPFLTTIKLQDGTTQEVQMNNITFTPAGSGNLDLSAITLLDRAGNPLVPTQWYEFILHPWAYINAVLPPAPAINLIHTKPVNIVRPSPWTLNTPALRRTQLNAYNTAPLGNGHVIENRMTSLYTHKRARQERDAFFRALKNGDGPKLDNLNNDQKEDLFQRVRNMYRLPDQTPNAAVLTPHAVTGLTDINSYPRNLPLSFGERFISNDHESVKDPKNIANVRAYMDYINNNIDAQITKYFDRRFDRIFTDDQNTNTFLKAQVTNYMQEIDRNKTDNDMHMDVDNDIHTNRDGNDRLHNRRRKILGLRIGRRDVGAQRFLSGSKKSIADQTVNISTNTHPEDLNNPEPEKYTLDLEVTPKNQFRVNIKIAWQEDFALKSWDPASLIRTVLRNDRIVNGKTRAHIAYNIIKWCIDMCKEKDISLRYRDPQTNHNMVIRTSDKNIIVEDQDSQTNYGGNNRRITQVLFDYKLFENTNTFEGNTNRSLRRWIDALMVHFTSAMNQLHDQYRLTTENKWRTKTKLPTSFFTSPIKKLLNLKTTTKFDFETTVTSSNGKKATVSLKKNTFSIMMDGLKKPIKGKSLGKLLEKRVGKVRIFDGIERDICGKVYESLITNMRKNTKIARSNFWVLDPMTGRAYIMDEDGEFGYIQAETIKQRNPIRRNNAAKIAGKAIVTGGLITGWVALGWATSAAIAGTLAATAATAAIGAVSPTLGTVAATATAVGWAGTFAVGAGIVSGVNLAQYLWRNSNRKRWVVETPPQGRTMCNEAEKRELLKNPFLMSGIIRAMSERLGRL